MQGCILCRETPLSDDSTDRFENSHVMPRQQIVLDALGLVPGVAYLSEVNKI